jgi:hypothetical protein
VPLRVENREPLHSKSLSPPAWDLACSASIRRRICPCTSYKFYACVNI